MPLKYVVFEYKSDNSEQDCSLIQHKLLVHSTRLCHLKIMVLNAVI